MSGGLGLLDGLVRSCQPAPPLPNVLLRGSHVLFLFVGWHLTLQAVAVAQGRGLRPTAGHRQFRDPRRWGDGASHAALVAIPDRARALILRGLRSPPLSEPRENGTAEAA